MNRIGWTLKSTIGVLIVAVLAGCDTSRTDSLDASRRATIESEVEAFLTRYRQAFDAGDPEALVDLYVTDDRFAIYEDGTLRYASPQSVVEAVASFPPGMSMTTEGDITDITPLTKDLAMASTTYRTQIAMPNGGAFAVEGVMTALLERSAEGWRVVRAHTSSVRERGGS
jgi:uncharacterized protein (TIGR02246 family)